MLASTAAFPCPEGPRYFPAARPRPRSRWRCAAWRILGGGDEAIASVLTRYSNALGIAYQIRDDIEDIADGEDPAIFRSCGPPCLWRSCMRKCVTKPADRALVERAWRRQCSPAELEQVRRLLESHQVEHRCQVLQESFKEEALRALGELQTTSLKGLLRRVVSKIFSLELGSWCSEFETRNAPGGQAGAEVARGLDRVGR